MLNDKECRILQKRNLIYLNVNERVLRCSGKYKGMCDKYYQWFGGESGEESNKTWITQEMISKTD
jgi:hypothetical protein